MTHLEKHENVINNQKTRTEIETDPQIIQVLELPHKDFKITTISILKKTEEKITKKMKNVNKELKTGRKNQMDILKRKEKIHEMKTHWMDLTSE